MDRQQVGQRHELLAERYLIRKGLRIRERNYRCRRGEIDLVAEDSETLVFVEVRYRGRRSLVSSEESVTRTKQQRLIRAANYYLLRSGEDRPCRFDVIAINRSALGPLTIRWIPNAFDAPA